jgi:hypothetical protein
MDWIRCAQRALLAGAAFVSAFISGDRPATFRRVWSFEPLEPRLPLSAAGLVDVGAQPEGGLSGKIAYIHGGHGYTAANQTGGAWSFQRPELFEMIEDLGNVDQMSYLGEYLFRAGATVVPLRPIGHQTNQVVLDNDDAGVTYVGSWSDSTATVFYGSAGDVPYKHASTSATETAYARYQPNIPQAGFYPIYAWTTSGSNRATDQLYRVNHSGGITEVTVNHRRVGNGLVYLGTYYFEAGTSGYVDISNRSNNAGSVVIADMIRFGNGMGDINRGGGVSGLAREDEAGLYWVQWHVDRAQGIPKSEYRAVDALGNPTQTDRDATVSLSPRYSEYMNREADGAVSDRVFVSFHSNAGGGRGVVGLHNTSHGGTTPNQVLLAQNLAQEVNDDLVAQTGQFEHDWFNRGSNILYESPDFNYGEINNSVINNEFDATIVEVAFHDNQLDAELMRDPKVRDALARATYQGLIDYFRAVDGNATPATALPAPVAGVRAESDASGSVTVSWLPPTSNSYLGGAPTSYRIYGSTNGYGFDGGTVVAGGATTSATFSGLDPNTPYYFKVVAVNDGGESPASEVVTALPSGGTKQVLVVNGFDRLARTQNPKQPFGAAPNTVERVRPRGGNSFDYTVQVASAIQSAAPGVHVNSTSNEAVISGAVNLADYDTVVWILGEESTANDTFDATEQTKVEQFLAGGGNLFLSGAEIGWDLDSQNNGRTYYETTLKGNYVSDDANTYAVTGVAGSIFAGLSILFDNGALYYDSEFADVISPQAGAQSALNYSNGAGGAAIQAAGTGGRGSIVMLAFPFETITTAANRAAVMDRVLDFFNVVAPVVENADFNSDGTVDAADFVVWRKNENTVVPPGTLGDANSDGQVNAADYDIWRSQFGTSPGTGAGARTGAASASQAVEPVVLGVEVVAEEPGPAMRKSALAASPWFLPSARKEVAADHVYAALDNSPYLREAPDLLALAAIGSGVRNLDPLEAIFDGACGAASDVQNESDAAHWSDLAVPWWRGL